MTNLMIGSPSANINYIQRQAKSVADRLEAKFHDSLVYYNKVRTMWNAGVGNMTTEEAVTDMRADWSVIDKNTKEDALVALHYIVDEEIRFKLHLKALSVKELDDEFEELMSRFATRKSPRM